MRDKIKDKMRKMKVDNQTLEMEWVRKTGDRQRE